MTLLCLPLLLAACASQRAPAEAAKCDLTVTFGSYAAGTDGKVEQEIAAYLRETPAVSIRSRTNWGREGEHTWCLGATSPKAARAAFQAIRAIIPAVSSQAWTEVKLADGETFRTDWPRP